METPTPARFAMPRRTLVELPTGRAWQVGCAAGSVWLTLDHDPRDLVLEPGTSFEVHPDQRALAYALEDAVLEVAAVAAPRSVRRSERSVARPLPWLALSPRAA